MLFRSKDSNEYSKTVKEEQIDEVSKGAAIRAYAAGSTYNYDDEHPKSDAIKGHIVRKFGKKAGEHAEKAAYTSLYGRDNRSNRVDQLAHAKPSSEMRKTKSGKIHKQDIASKKDEIGFRKSMKKFEKKGHLPEETLDEISRGLARDAARAADQKAANIRQADQRGSGVFKNVPGQMHDDSIAMKVAKHYEGKAKKFRDYADKKTPGFKQSSNELKKYASDAAIRKASKVTEQSLDEKLTKSMSPADVISDFVHSDDPKFKGKSKKERMKMALGAFYGMHPEKSRK